MNALLFGCVVGLMLGGGGYLLLGRRRLGRGLACTAIAGGVGVLAVGIDAWFVLAVDGLLIAGLLVTTLRREHSSSTTSEIASDEVDMPDDDSGDHSNASSPLRKAVASLISAAVGGILLNVIWSNPVWRIKGFTERGSAGPGTGMILILLIIVPILLFSFVSERGRIGAARTSRKTET